MPNAFQYNSGLPYDTNVAYNAYAPAETPVTEVNLDHLSTAFTIHQDGSFLTVHQDTLEEVAQCVSMIVGTTPGDRTVVPGFGIPQQPFDGPNAGQIENAITTWEPRAFAKVAIENDGRGNANVKVAVSLRKGN